MLKNLPKVHERADVRELLINQERAFSHTKEFCTDTESESYFENYSRNQERAQALNHPQQLSEPSLWNYPSLMSEPT